MNKTALYIPRPGTTSLMVQHGYVDALRELGWKVYVINPQNKLNCEKLIVEYGVNLIMTSSRYGIRQLPIDIINKNNVVVFVNILPLNSQRISIDNQYELAHIDEPNILKKINLLVTHTNIEPHLWDSYMDIWLKNCINIQHIPWAGNLIKAVPFSYIPIVDVAMVANFGHRQDIMRQLIEPLFKRLDLLGYSYHAFGDDIWHMAGLKYNGSLGTNIDKLADIYSTAIICPNVHTKKQIELQAFINERSFTILLCGGIQISDNLLAKKYFKEHCFVSTSTTNYIQQITAWLNNPQDRFDRIRNSIEYIANYHTYFNRLINLFQQINMNNYSKLIEDYKHKLITRYCWEIDCRINASQRNIVYEHETF
ncbi:MAG: glycosyltransferase family 1 protein [Candidatus Heimdallarchaeota archaeon]|nr:MAG: glycosyltransferase family 1 protein [Candidatus Heimdallarchaeota archaeon]